MKKFYLAALAVFALNGIASAQLFAPPCATCPQAQPQQAGIQWASFAQPVQQPTFQQAPTFTGGCCQQAQAQQSQPRRRLFAIFGRRCR